MELFPKLQSVYDLFGFSDWFSSQVHSDVAANVHDFRIDIRYNDTAHRGVNYDRSFFGIVTTEQIRDSLRVSCPSYLGCYLRLRFVFHCAVTILSAWRKSKTFISGLADPLVPYGD